MKLPRRSRGRPSAAARARYDDEVMEFRDFILNIRSGLDFTPSSRGWAYILEGQNIITKGDLNAAQDLINDCRKSGDLPLNICAEDVSRAFKNLEYIDQTTPDQRAAGIVEEINSAHLSYQPWSFWEDQDVYIEMLVEKIDLRNLFGPICEDFSIPIANIKGWPDINSRAAMMQRFENWELEGKQCVLLYCGDHDPAGLNISECLRTMLMDLSDAVEWFPDQLIIERFGLNADFIEGHNLTWIDNLETSSGRPLNNPRHPDHRKPYVQTYLRQFGVRKVEANALVVNPSAGRKLCRDTILRYLDPEAPTQYADKLSEVQEVVHQEVLNLLGGDGSAG